MTLQYKNRDRGAPSFGNINLLGPCNLDCYFCLGRDLDGELWPENSLRILPWEMPRITEYLALCAEHNVRRLYITGLNTDPLIYVYLGDMISWLQNMGYEVGVRTNGQHAECMWRTLSKCRGSVGYTILTLDPGTMEKITGSDRIPPWRIIVGRVFARQRFSTVVTKWNVDQFFEIAKFVSDLWIVEYLQVRKVSTDRRADELQRDMECYDELLARVRADFLEIGSVAGAPMFQIGNLQMPVVFWNTVGTRANSLNYFANGVITDDYFIIEGYCKAKGIPI